MSSSTDDFDHKTYAHDAESVALDIPYNRLAGGDKEDVTEVRINVRADKDDKITEEKTPAQKQDSNLFLKTTCQASPVNEAFFDYLDTKTALHFAFFPEGRVQLQKYLNRNTGGEAELFSLICFFARTLSATENLRQTANTYVAEENEKISKSWFKKSVLVNLGILSGYAMVLWKGTAHYITKAISATNTYYFLNGARENLSKQLEAVCSSVFPSDFYGDYLCQEVRSPNTGKVISEVCNVVEQVFFDSDCKQYNYGNTLASATLVSGLQNCSAPLWQNFTDICKQYPDTMTPGTRDFNIFFILFMTISVLSVAEGILWLGGCRKTLKEKDLIDKESVLNNACKTAFLDNPELTDQQKFCIRYLAENQPTQPSMTSRFLNLFRCGKPKRNTPQQIIDWTKATPDSSIAKACELFKKEKEAKEYQSPLDIPCSFFRKPAPSDKNNQSQSEPHTPASGHNANFDP